MHSGDATHAVATWHVLISGVDAPIVGLLGFPADFQFFMPSFLNFSTPHFPFHFFQTPNHCSEHLLLQPSSVIFL